MPADRPNVLLIHTDQQRWDALGANGNDEIHTPNLDRLASEGVNFDRYFVQAPVCMPSRESYLTGQYPSQLDIYTNGITLPEDVRTLPGMLDNYGYHSANLGKLHFLPHANRDHRKSHPSYGFDRLEISDEPGSYPDAYRKWVERNDPSALDDVSVGLPPATTRWPADIGVDDIEHPEPRFTLESRPFPADADLTHTAFVADRTLDYLESQAGNDPFLGIAGFYSPHSPWVAPQEYLDLYDPDELSIPDFPPAVEKERREIAEDADHGDPTVETFTDEEIREVRRGYYAMISEVDHHVGRILDRLEELGIAEETLVIFTADHGDWLGDFLQYGKGWPCQDPVVRVPFIARWPEAIEEPGRTVSDIVEAVDLVPTILDAAGVQTPPNLLGESLLPAIEEGGGLEREAESALVEDESGKILRTDGYRYVLHEDGGEELYDLDAEYGPYRDVSNDRPEVLADHRHRLARRLTGIDIGSQRRLDYAY